MSQLVWLRPLTTFRRKAVAFSPGDHKGISPRSGSEGSLPSSASWSNILNLRPEGSRSLGSRAADTRSDMEFHLLSRGFQKQDQSLPSMACDLSVLESMPRGNGLRKSRLSRIFSRNSGRCSWRASVSEGMGRARRKYGSH